MQSRWIIRIAGGMAAAFLLLGAAQATQYWEIDPVADPAVSVGTYAVVGGKTSPDGVNFKLPNNSLDQPIELTLIAKAPSAPLHLSAFKDDGQSFLDKDTDAHGRLSLKFRTGDTMEFKVTGAAGAAYQLSVWRGPAIVLPHPDPVVSMAAVTGHADSAATPAPSPPAASGGARAPAAATGSNTLIYLLLGGILLALVVIAFLVYRGQQMRAKP